MMPISLLPPKAVKSSQLMTFARHDSAIANTHVIIVLDDDARKSVPIILPQQAKRPVLQSLEKRRYGATKSEERAAGH